MKIVRGNTGFTLIEMIVVIAVSAVVAVMLGRNISRPLLAFEDVTRRAALVDAGSTALARMTREARLALPNSVRISGGTALEFLRTRTGGRYRAASDPSGATCPGSVCDALDFTGTDVSFQVLDGDAIDAFGEICTAVPSNCGGGAASTAACMADGTIDCLVVYNTGQPADCAAAGVSVRTNAYCGDNVAGIEAADAAGKEIRFVHDLGNFPLASPQQRFYVVDTPVSYVCNLAAGTLSRYDGYAIDALQPNAGAPPATAPRVLADKVTACSFSYDPGSATRAALVTVTLALADSDAPDEVIRLFQQAHVPNIP